MSAVIRLLTDAIVRNSGGEEVLGLVKECRSDNGRRR